MHRLRLLAFAALSTLALDACGIYRVSVQQGNVVTPKELAKVHSGMDRLQVRTLLGSPVLKDPWHPDQWIYAYSYKPAYGATRTQRVTVVFGKDGLVQSVRGRVHPLPGDQGAS